MSAQCIKTAAKIIPYFPYHFLLCLLSAMKIWSPAISRLARLRYWNIEQWLLNPVNAQREVLQDLVTHAQNTEIGRKYGFHELFNIRSFKESVPIHEYDDLKPYIERVMCGEQNLLWDTPVYWFAK